MSLRQTNDIEALSERLESLQITNEALEEISEQSDEEISVVLAPVMMNNNIQAVMLKSMVPDPKWFDRDQTKFEDWWRGI